MLVSLLFIYDSVFVLGDCFPRAVPPELPEDLLNFLELNVDPKSFDDFIIFSERVHGFDCVACVHL